MRIDTVRAYLPFPSLLIQLDGTRTDNTRSFSVSSVSMYKVMCAGDQQFFPLFISRIVRPFHLEYIIINQVKEKKMKPAACARAVRIFHINNKWMQRVWVYRDYAVHILHMGTSDAPAYYREQVPQSADVFRIMPTTTTTNTQTHTHPNTTK